MLTIQPLPYQRCGWFDQPHRQTWGNLSPMSIDGSYDDTHKVGYAKYSATSMSTDEAHKVRYIYGSTDDTHKVSYTDLD